MRRAVILLGALLLAGCDDPIVVPSFYLDVAITDISFKGAHQDEHCSKGCRYEFVPDRWYLNFCPTDKNYGCLWRKIEHAPWRWEVVGATLKVQAHRHKSGEWHIDRFLIADKAIDL